MAWTEKGNRGRGMEGANRWGIGRKNPMRHFWDISEALLGGGSMLPAPFDILPHSPCSLPNVGSEDSSWFRRLECIS